MSSSSRNKMRRVVNCCVGSTCGRGRICCGEEPFGSNAFLRHRLMPCRQRRSPNTNRWDLKSSTLRMMYRAIPRNLARTRHRESKSRRGRQRYMTRICPVYNAAFAERDFAGYELDLASAAALCSIRKLMRFCSVSPSSSRAVAYMVCTSDAPMAMPTCRASSDANLRYSSAALGNPPGIARATSSSRSFPTHRLAAGTSASTMLSARIKESRPGLADHTRCAVAARSASIWRVRTRQGMEGSGCGGRTEAWS